MLLFCPFCCRFLVALFLLVLLAPGSVFSYRSLVVLFRFVLLALAFFV